MFFDFRLLQSSWRSYFFQVRFVWERKCLLNVNLVNCPCSSHQKNLLEKLFSFSFSFWVLSENPRTCVSECTCMWEREVIVEVGCSDICSDFHFKIITVFANDCDPYSRVNLVYFWREQYFLGIITENYRMFLQKLSTQIIHL